MEIHDQSVVKLEKSVSLIAQGLYETENNASLYPDIYPVSAIFRKGYNMFLELRRSFGGIMDYKYGNISSFFDKFLLNPLPEWFSDWDSSAIEIIKQNAPHIYHQDAFLKKNPLMVFKCTPSCYEFIDSLDHNILRNIEQKSVYNNLKELNDADYVTIRRFIIEHGEISESEFKDIQDRFFSNKQAMKALNNAYRNNGMGKYEWVPGVKQFIAEPGIFELDLEKFCKDQGLDCQLWPDGDTYDLMIYFQNGKKWAIDVKAYQNPYNLRNKIFSDYGFPYGDYDRGFFAVPDEKTKGFPHYTDIVNEYFRINPQDKDVSCVTMSKIKKAIKEEKKRG